MKNTTKILYIVAILALSFASAAGLRTMAQEQGGYVRFVRGINTAELGVAHPVGLTYSPEANAFTVAQETAAGGQSLAVITMYEYLREVNAGTQKYPDPANMANDASSGRTFVLDAASNQIKVAGSGATAAINLKSIGVSNFSGMAYNPTDNHLYLMNPENKTIYKIDDTGAMAAYFDLSGFPVNDPRGMVFAPSGDRTDDPAIMNLFIADTSGQIAEISFTEPKLVDLPAVQASVSLVNTIHTSQWDPASPDPAGIDAMPDGNMLVVDSEIDEDELAWLDQGVNAWIMEPDGTVVQTCDDLYNYDKEPTGVAVNFVTGEVYVADDNTHGLPPDEFKRINVVTSFCTANDIFYRFPVTEFGVDDPESVAHGDGKLFIGDGLNAEVFIITPDQSGEFNSNATVRSFDTASLNIFDLEGMTYHHGRGTLFLISRQNPIFILEVSTNGDPLNMWDLGSLSLVGLGGLGSGPSSTNPSQMNLFIADRGIDNNTNPMENDGIIYEVSIGDTPQQPGSERIFLPFIMQSGN